MRSLNPAVPEWLDDLISRLLAKKAEDRIQSAADVAETLALRLPELTRDLPTPVTPRPLTARAAGRHLPRAGGVNGR